MRTFFTFLTLVSLFGSYSALASPGEILFGIQTRLQDSIQKVVQDFDPKAQAIVIVETKNQDVSLPSVPFLVKNLSITSENGLPRINSIQVKILTSADKIPPSIERVIEEICSPYGVKPVTEISNLPVDDQKISTGPSVVSKLGETFSDPKIYLVLVILILSVLGGRLALNAMQGLRDSVQSGMGQLASALESSGGGNETSASLGQEQQNNQAQGSSDATADHLISDLSEVSLTALVFDCYWCGSDSYAAYIWNRIPIEKRQRILEQNKPLESYVRFLVQMGQPADVGNLNRHQEPYYLFPLPINHLDNQALVFLIKKYPEMLMDLPTLRVESLPLRASEKMKLLSGLKSENGKASAVFRQNLEKVKASALRPIPKTTKIKIHSIDEEIELIQSEIQPEMKSQIPTLAWLAELDDSVVSEVLESFSAQQLASAWIGPEDVLQKLGRCMPEKKLKLVSSYLESVRPSRESPVFQSLHRAALQRVHESEKKAA